MVAKIVSGQSIRGLLNYNENKVREGQASLVMANNFGTDLDKLDFASKLNRFQHLTCLNSRVKTNALHVMLNFVKEDRLSLPTMQKIAMEYMDRIGFGDQPFLAYLHKDANHPHLHLVTTNMQPDGKRIPIHNIGKLLSEPARKELEKEYKLTVAEGRRNTEMAVSPVDIEKAIYGKVPTKRAINNVVNAVLNNYKFTSFPEFNAALSQFGVRADRGRENTLMFEKRGLIYSIINKQGEAVGIPFKASSLSNKPLLDAVETKFDLNKEQRLAYQQPLKDVIDGVLSRYDTITQSTFHLELNKSRVSLILRKSEEGLIYGATFIDHNNKTVFNGSSLGKPYSAKAFTANFGTADVPKTYLQKQKRSTFRQTQEEGKSFLPPVNQTNYLEILLNKTNADYGVSFPAKKKKRKRGRSL